MKILTTQFLKGYLKIILTIGLLVIGLLHLPSMNMRSLAGIFSTLWFSVGALIVVANFVYITKIEKSQSRVRKRAFNRRTSRYR
ncbi:hypothetical protein HYG86_13085 [Alkalicella caledoniensis]|uniref:Uncharacterized protein n=1 Tax=Alkalicella caledoniensis TaxID=2731377 RepID=A0A7G9WAD0_ALKCA|nr:hypothetical protein [Alkalicella caledoniensis]QNO15642.1 hypothetical protein HYG86_13085 [Alkalicella caledoniensis]